MDDNWLEGEHILGKIQECSEKDHEGHLLYGFIFARTCPPE